MDQNLVGYLLNALDADDRRQVEAYLHGSPEARARLERLRRTLAPLAADAEPPAPPPGLAINTLARIAEHRCRPLPRAPRPRPQERGPLPRRWLRPLDVCAAAVLLILLGGLLTSWLVRQRQQEQLLACQDNLRRFWLALEQYSEAPDHARQFPRVEAEGPRAVAGIFVPLLQDAKLLGPDVSVTCPAAGRRPPPAVTVGQLETLYWDDRDAYTRVAPALAGNYAYTLGYLDHDTLCGLRRDSGDLLPILADRPPFDGLGNSPNHGGGVQNVLYIGGNVRKCSERTVGVAGDDIYLNRSGQLRTGESLTDTVLAPSEVAPLPRR